MLTLACVASLAQCHDAPRAGPREGDEVFQSSEIHDDRVAVGPERGEVRELPASRLPRVDEKLSSKVLEELERLREGSDSASVDYGSMSARLEVPKACRDDPSPANCCDAGLTPVAGDDSGNLLLFAHATRGHCLEGFGNLDVIMTSNHHSVAFGGTEDDQLVSTGGGDYLFGGPGADIIAQQYGAGSLYARGGPGNDVISGFNGADWLVGDGDDDTISGGGGDDSLWPGLGSDTVYGNSGNDTIVIRDLCEIELGEYLDGGPGDDTLRTPVPRSELEAAGATISSIENVVVDPSLSCLSECIVGPVPGADGAKLSFLNPKGGQVVVMPGTSQIDVEILAEHSHGIVTVHDAAGERSFELDESNRVTTTATINPSLESNRVCVRAEGCHGTQVAQTEKCIRSVVGHDLDFQVLEPGIGAVVSSPNIGIRGHVVRGVASTLTVSGGAARLRGKQFDAEVPLSPGLNSIEVVATSPSGDMVRKTVIVGRDSLPMLRVRVRLTADHGRILDSTNVGATNYSLRQQGRFAYRMLDVAGIELHRGRMRGPPTTLSHFVDAAGNPRSAELPSLPIVHELFVPNIPGAASLEFLDAFGRLIGHGEL